MKIFLFLGSRRGYAVLKKLVEIKSNIVGILCLVEDSHEEQYHELITKIANENKIPIFYSTKIKPSGYAKILTHFQPDIAFVIGWRYLIVKEAYSIPLKGTLIIHDSLLPAYRGFAPMNWAIINGESKTGVTLFYIEDGIDCGPIVDQLVINITLEDTAYTIDQKIIKLYEEIILKNLSLLMEDKIKAIPQNENLATYTCKRIPEDGEINWNLSAIQIYNLIRGLTRPFPGAYTIFQNKKLFIWSAELPTSIEKNYVGHIPGRVLGKQDNKIAVLTGKGVIYLKEIQFENEKSSSHILMSVKDTLGKR